MTPFILRRTKDSVLRDLPPKILQDVYCDLSPLQAALYEDFSASQASRELETSLVTNDRQAAGEEAAPHVFQVTPPPFSSHRAYLCRWAAMLS